MRATQKTPTSRATAGRGDLEDAEREGDGDERMRRANNSPASGGRLRVPVFSAAFCAKLREECAHFERSGMPLSRPNTMNDNGLLLFELGAYENLLDPLVRDYVAPVAAALFGDEGRGDPATGAGPRG